MPLAAPVWKVPRCNRNCEPLLKCPPGSHVSKNHRSCVWHGRDGSYSASKSSSPGILSSLFGSTPSSTTVVPSTPSAGLGNIFTREPAAPNVDFDNYMRSRQADSEPEFGGGGRRRSRHRSGRRHSRRRSGSKRRKTRRRSTKRKRRRSTRRKSRH